VQKICGWYGQDQPDIGSVCHNVGQQLCNRAGSRLVDEELRQKGHQDMSSTGKMESGLRMIMDNVTLPHQALS